MFIPNLQYVDYSNQPQTRLSSTHSWCPIVQSRKITSDVQEASCPQTLTLSHVTGDTIQVLVFLNRPPKKKNINKKKSTPCSHPKRKQYQETLRDRGQHTQHSAGRRSASCFLLTQCTLEMCELGRGECFTDQSSLSNTDCLLPHQIQKWNLEPPSATSTSTPPPPLNYMEVCVHMHLGLLVLILLMLSCSPALSMTTLWFLWNKEIYPKESQCAICVAQSWFSPTL